MYFDISVNEFKEVDKAAAKLAFAGADQELSWRELKDLSDAICHKLEETKIPEGAPVIIYGEKEAFFLAALLSCFRKKLPFIPIEPSLPAKRMDNLVAQSGAKLCIVCGDYPQAPQLPICITNKLEIKGESAFDVIHANIAYILFTSGSSGAPKGVLITRENLISFTNWFCKNFPVDHKTVFINQASMLFDISLADVFGALQTGATAIFSTPIQVRDGSFFDRIKQYKGSYWNSTPSFVSVCMANKEFNSKHLPHITCFTLSGEQLPVNLVNELWSRFPEARIINAYGPTETCIFASFAEIVPDMLSKEILPIAKLPTEYLRLKKNLLFIEGKQVGQGYLTGERFSKLYDTGDIGSLKKEYVYFLGRRDSQIKFNGYRIELDEIKLALQEVEDVRQAECIPVKIDGKIKRLVAFVLFREGFHADSELLKLHLSKTLPAYMIPSEIISVKEFPLTASGKTDKDQLEYNYHRQYT